MNKVKLLLIKATVVFSLILFLASCSKDEESSGLFGTWTSEGTFDFEDYELDYTQTLKLTETSYELVGSVVHPVFSTEHEILGFRGPLEVDGDSLFFSIQEAAFAEVDESTFAIKELVYYKAGDPEFEDAMANIDETVPLRAKYEIRDDGKLYITGDSNDDGDTDDDFESTEFTR